MPKFNAYLMSGSDSRGGATHYRQIEAPSVGQAATRFAAIADVALAARPGDDITVVPMSGRASHFHVASRGAGRAHGLKPAYDPFKNPPMLTVAMFHPTTLAGVQRIVPALTADEAVHKLFDKFPPRPGHHLEVRRDGRVIGQWFVSKGAHANPEMIKPAVSATALANMAMYYVVISGKVPPALSTVVRAPNAALAALEVSKYDDVHPGDIAAVYSMGYGRGGAGGQLIEKFRVRAIHGNPGQVLFAGRDKATGKRWTMPVLGRTVADAKRINRSIEKLYRGAGKDTDLRFVRAR